MLSFRGAAQKMRVTPPISVQGLAQRFGISPPVPTDQLIKDIEALPTELDFDAPSIVFGGGVPVGGFSHLTLRQDGTYTFSGRFHDSGATEYNTSG